ncbi:MAG: hypothetical protein JWO05_2109 [Gemmatimonadetes bacterium]|nr:hypothetical protein [Gemmatimonadota bacterium]
MKPVVEKLRRQYSNPDKPEVVLKFEDGHEIKLKKGESKAFDAWKGETIKVLAVYDPTIRERELMAVKKAEEFDEA